MYDALGSVLDHAEQIAASLRPEVLVPSDAARLLARFARLKNVAAAGEALCAARVADTNAWRAEGDRCPARFISRTTGTSVGQALEAIDTGKALPDLPHADRAFRSGALSPAQAKEIAKAGRADPSAEASLVEKAQRQSLAELKDECRKVTAAATDEDEQDEKIHAERYLRHWTDSDGAGRVDARMRTRDMALLLSYLQPFQDRVFAEARADGRRESSEAYALDALLAMAGVASGRRAPSEPAAADGENEGDDGASAGASADAPAGRWNPRPSIRLRADLSAVLRGNTVSGETCEIAGEGPVPVDLLSDLLPK